MSDEDVNGSTAPFEQWAVEKYKEIQKSINACDENGNLDPVRLNYVLTIFSQNFAWAITIQEIESNRLSKLTQEYDNWSKKKFNEAFRVIREEAGGGGRAPSQATVEARVVEINEDERAILVHELETQKSRVELLRGFVKVLDRQASILQTLSSNMRSELFFASEPTLGGGKGSQDHDAALRNRAKLVLKKAMAKQPTETDELEEPKES
jgi:hypothetical protein